MATCEHCGYDDEILTNELAAADKAIDDKDKEIERLKDRVNDLVATLLTIADDMKEEDFTYEELGD